MSRLDLRFEADSAEICSGRGSTVDVTVCGLSESDVLDQISAKDAIGYYGEDAILDEIDDSAVVSHCGPDELLAEMDTKYVLDSIGIDEITEWLRNTGHML
jgi:hypothetical protein